MSGVHARQSLVDIASDQPAMKRESTTQRALDAVARFVVLDDQNYRITSRVERLPSGQFRAPATAIARVRSQSDPFRHDLHPKARGLQINHCGAPYAADR